MERRFLIILFYILHIDHSFCLEISEKVKNICGLQEKKENYSDLYSRLSNGEEFQHGNYPWLTAIVEKDIYRNNRRFICGGSLITDSHVITAAHCVQPKDKKRKLPENLIVILGAHNLSDPYEAEKEFSRVKSVFIHGDYETTTINHSRFTGDLSLITLIKNITFTHHIRPICVFIENETSEKFANGILAGWGQTLFTEKNSEVPYAITIPIVDDGTCYRSDSRLATIAWDKSFCAGSEGKGACKGDSGSGFYVKKRNRFYLKGVVSSAISGGGCSGDHMVIFTDVTKYNLSGKTSFQPQKFVEKCNEYSKIKYEKLISQRRIGGTITDLGEFPHMAAIGFQNSYDPNRIDYVCGGALISEKFILTAAHCFVKREFKATTVKLGRASLLIEDEDDDNPHIDISIKNITRHPDYKRSAKYNDIALIELEKDVNFTYYARPACLHNPGKEISSQLHFTGWGRTSSDYDELSHWLLKGALNETDFNTCKAKYDALELNSIPEGLQGSSQICALGKLGDQIVGPCQGDGGGPLQYKEKAAFNESIGVVYGIVSFGAACGSENFEGVYTRVSHYLDWIENIVWP